jgi:hypothetical protein
MKRLGLRATAFLPAAEAGVSPGEDAQANPS